MELIGARFNQVPVRQPAASDRPEKWLGGFILAGGQSTRMGRDKALLKLQNQPLALRASDLLRPLTDDVTLLGQPGLLGGYDVPVLPDDHPSQGPLGAICTALRHSTHEWNLFLACDMPMMTAQTI